ncbi:MAG: rhomboid family intramembrane serine protease [Sphaerochaetaceae bacterium]|nr:rhomboid family intramembrane serine protease [Sphaerochaetaceae bacterium]
MKDSFLNRRMRYSYTNVTLKLVIINVLVFFLTEFIYPRSVYYLAMIPSFVLHGYVWQLFTYMFVHGGFSHVLFNMLGLYIFGSMVERRIGSREFLLFYLLTGTLSGIFSFVAYLLAGVNVVLVGASGALYAVMLMFAVLYPYAVVYVFGLIPMRAPLLVAVYFVIELVSQFTGLNGGVAHLTHLGGLLFAYLYCLVRMRIDPVKEWRRH